MKIRAIIVDDEKQSRVVLRSLLEKHAPEIEIIGEADGAETAYSLILELQPHLIFLDIQMPRANGFDLLRKFKATFFEVIFVTSYDKYAITAIKFSALDYLLKPVEVDELSRAVSRAKEKIIFREQTFNQIANLLDSLDKKTSDLKITVHVGEAVKFIKSSEVVFIEGDGSYCHIHTDDGQRYTTSKYIKDFEDYFGENSKFVRTHKNCLINVLHIKGYTKGEPCIIELVNGKTIEVARRKKQEVLEKLKKTKP